MCTLFGGGGGGETKVGTQKIGYESAYRQINQNVLSRYNLEEKYELAPRHVIGIMTEKTRSDDRRNLIFVLTELSYNAAGKAFPEEKLYWKHVL